MTPPPPGEAPYGSGEAPYGSADPPPYGSAGWGSGCDCDCELETGAVAWAGSDPARTRPARNASTSTKTISVTTDSRRIDSECCISSTFGRVLVAFLRNLLTLVTGFGPIFHL